MSERGEMKKNAAAVLAVSFIFCSLGAWARPWYPDEKSGEAVVGQGKAGNSAPAAATGKTACRLLSSADLKQSLKTLVLESAAQARGSLTLPANQVSSGVRAWLKSRAGAQGPSGGILNCFFPDSGRSPQKSLMELSLARDMSRWVSRNPPADGGAKLSPKWVSRFLDAANSDASRILGKSIFKNKKRKGREMKRSSGALASLANSGVQQQSINKARAGQIQTNVQNKAFQFAVGRALPPPSPTRERYLRVISKRIIANGAGPQALDYARKIQLGMLSHAPISLLRRLADGPTSISILPLGKRLTQIPPFTSLAGKKTFDGRPWEKVAGIAEAIRDKRGRWGGEIVAPESDLIGRGPLDADQHYRKGQVLLHEYGHAVRFTLPSESDWKWRGSGKDATLTLRGMASRLHGSLSGILAAFKSPRYLPTISDSQAVYESAMRNYGTIGLGRYADSNANEAFAQATSAYFGVGSNGETAAILRRRDPPMYRLMREVYGRASADRFYKKGERSVIARVRFKQWTRNLLPPWPGYKRSMFLESAAIYARLSHDQKLIREMCGKVGPVRCEKYFHGPLPKGI